MRITHYIFYSTNFYIIVSAIKYYSPFLNLKYIASAISFITRS